MANENTFGLCHPGGARVGGVEKPAKVPRQIGRIPVSAVDTLGQPNAPGEILLRAVPYDHSNIMPLVGLPTVLWILLPGPFSRSGPGGADRIMRPTRGKPSRPVREMQLGSPRTWTRYSRSCRGEPA